MNHGMPGLPVHDQPPEFTQTHVHGVSDAIQPSHSVIPFSFCPQSFPESGSFQISQLFTSSGQSIGASASTSVLGWVYTHTHTHTHTHIHMCIYIYTHTCAHAHTRVCVHVCAYVCVYVYIYTYTHTYNNLRLPWWLRQ